MKIERIECVFYFTITTRLKSCFVFAAHQEVEALDLSGVIALENSLVLFCVKFEFHFLRLVFHS